MAIKAERGNFAFDSLHPYPGWWLDRYQVWYQVGYQVGTRYSTRWVPEHPSCAYMGTQAVAPLDSPLVAGWVPGCPRTSAVTPKRPNLAASWNDPGTLPATPHTGKPASVDQQEQLLTITITILATQATPPTSSSLRSTLSELYPEHASRPIRRTRCASSSPPSSCIQCGPR